MIPAEPLPLKLLLSQCFLLLDLCPSDVKCTSILPRHFKEYSHKQLASARSLQIPEKLTSDKVGLNMVYTMFEAIFICSKLCNVQENCYIIKKCV